MANDLYREEILDHYHSPRNFGKPSVFTSAASKKNPLCGDSLSAYITVKGDKLKVHFDGVGCAISIASASLLSEYVTGKTKKEVLALTPEKVLAITHLNPTPTRIKCALLSLEVLQQAIIDSA